MGYVILSDRRERRIPSTLSLNQRRWGFFDLRSQNDIAVKRHQAVTAAKLDALLQAFFDALFALVERTSQELEETLQYKA
jgi:hypothetical protein